jgi:hypothetical protein
MSDTGGDAPKAGIGIANESPAFGLDWIRRRG